MVTRRRETIAEGLAREAAESADRDAARRRDAELHRLRHTVRRLTDEVKTLTTDLADANTYREALAYVEANPLEPITIRPRERKSRSNEAIGIQILSDLHVDERVDPAEVNGINEFDPTIAAERMHRLAVGTAWQLNMLRCDGTRSVGYRMRELVIANLGDVTTNYLRTEDLHGNAMPPMDGFVFAASLEVAYVRQVLELCPWLEKVHCPRVPGNHDRLPFERRTPVRKRVAMSSAPLLAHMIAAELRGDPRVQIQLSPSEHVYLDIYGRKIRGMHGDRFKYNGGVGGIFVPARRHVVGLNKSIDAALTIFGHWHMSRTDDRWISNGSLIGPTPYSIAFGLDPEPPSQTLFLIDRDRGKRNVTPIQVGGKDEWS